MAEQWVVLCRAGFEGECAAELEDRARGRGIEGRARGGPGGGVVRWEEEPPAGGTRPWEAFGAAELIFARQAFWLLEEVSGLPRERTAGALAARVREGLARRAGLTGVSQVFLEAPDTEAGRALWPRCSRRAGPLDAALAASGVLEGGTGKGRPRLHVFFTEPDRAWIGLSDPARSPPWPMGIPRLKLPRSAPSRSALKLEEALWTFVPEGERGRRLRAGMRAVDLGAAPGGWTWQLTRFGLVVAAVDNGPLDPRLAKTGLVEHVRADGFTWRPARPVDWMVCDMVAPPARVARLVGIWASRGLCRESVFNLKLPNRGGYGEVRRCEAILRRELEARGLRYRLRFKHLYHDRREVTGHVQVGRPALPGGTRKGPGRPPPRRGRRR